MQTIKSLLPLIINAIHASISSQTSPTGYLDKNDAIRTGISILFAILGYYSSGDTSISVAFGMAPVIISDILRGTGHADIVPATYPVETSTESTPNV